MSFSRIRIHIYGCFPTPLGSIDFFYDTTLEGLAACTNWWGSIDANTNGNEGIWFVFIEVNVCNLCSCSPTLSESLP